MLTIRKEQWDLFAEEERRKFEDWMHDHVREQLPGEYRAAGEEEIRELIRYGRERAASYGIQSRRDVCKYIDLMVVLGKDFDVDARFPWAAEILRKPRDPVARIHFLYKAATDHLNARRH